MQLRLVVPDFHLDRESLEGVSTDALPRLPALEAMLRFGVPDAAPSHWRTRVARLAGREDLASHPPAQVVAAVAGLPAPESAWFATPVHRVAGLDHLRLHPAGLLRLDAAARLALAADFARSFGADGLALHAVGDSLLLTGLHAIDAQTSEPSRLLGADLRGAVPTGPGASALRRLGAEIEMWLHDRAAGIPSPTGRGLPVNGLWLWGGGPAPAAVPAPSAAPGSAGQLFADDPHAVALWTLGGSAAAALPARAADLLASVAGTDGPVIACAGAAPRAPGDRPMERLEADWFAPLLTAWRAGRIDALGLHVGGRGWRLRRPFGWQRWRRTRPWWEVLAA